MASKTKKGATPKVVALPYEKRFYGLEAEMASRGFDTKTMPAIQTELYCFARGSTGSQYFEDKRPNAEGKAAEYHFWRAAQMLWNYPGSTQPVHLHPWSLRMVSALCKHKYLSIAGCASSGKSRTLAIWGIINFLASPNHTKVILTSTTLKDSKDRIWGDVTKLWDAMVAQGPGNLVPSYGKIRYVDPKTGKEDETRGLSLLAGEKSKETESIGKMKGFKAPRLIFIADELPDLSEALIAAAKSNLASNDRFQFIGTGNPTSYYDPHGILSEPLDGWTSVTEQDYEWQGKRAYVIRFDAEKSPNFGPEGEKWPYLMTRKRLKEYREDLGERSLGYYCMVKGFWFSETAEDMIYSAAAFQRYGVHDKAVFKGATKKVAGLDLGFTNGGDKTVLTIGKVGLNTEDVQTVELTKTYTLFEDATNRTKDRNEQIAEKVKEICEAEGVAPEDLAIDATGGGTPWASILAMKWSNAFTRVQFGGDAEDKEKYYNRVSELWFLGQPLVRSGQIRGVGASLAREMLARTYTLRGKRIQVTPKEEMKPKLGGRSPDEADSFFLMLAMAMKKHKLTSAEKPGGVVGGKSFVQKRMRELADIYAA